MIHGQTVECSTIVDRINHKGRSVKTQSWNGERGIKTRKKTLPLFLSQPLFSQPLKSSLNSLLFSPLFQPPIYKTSYFLFSKHFKSLLFFVTGTQWHQRDNVERKVQAQNPKEKGKLPLEIIRRTLSLGSTPPLKSFKLNKPSNVAWLRRCITNTYFKVISHHLNKFSIPLTSFLHWGQYKF